MANFCPEQGVGWRDWPRGAALAQTPRLAAARLVQRAASGLAALHAAAARQASASQELTTCGTWPGHLTRRRRWARHQAPAGHTGGPGAMSGLTADGMKSVHTWALRSVIRQQLMAAKPLGSTTLALCFAPASHRELSAARVRLPGLLPSGAPPSAPPASGAQPPSGPACWSAAPSASGPQPPSGPPCCPSAAPPSGAPCPAATPSEGAQPPDAAPPCDAAAAAATPASAPPSAQSPPSRWP